MDIGTLITLLEKEATYCDKLIDDLITGKIVISRDGVSQPWEETAQRLSFIAATMREAARHCTDRMESFLVH